MKIGVGNLELHIRKATWDDYQFCHRLAKRNMIDYVIKYWGGWKPKQYRKHFIPQNTRIILYNKRRISFYRTRLETDSLYLEDMQVSGRMKNKGIGSHILKLIEEKMVQSDRGKIRLRVFKDNPARRLFERFGYKIKDEDDASFLMEKSVKVSK